MSTLDSNSIGIKQGIGIMPIQDTGFTTLSTRIPDYHFAVFNQIKANRVCVIPLMRCSEKTWNEIENVEKIMQLWLIAIQIDSKGNVTLGVRDNLYAQYSDFKRSDLQLYICDLSRSSLVGKVKKVDSLHLYIEDGYKRGSFAYPLACYFRFYAYGHTGKLDGSHEVLEWAERKIHDTQVMSVLQSPDKRMAALLSAKREAVANTVVKTQAVTLRIPTFYFIVNTRETGHLKVIPLTEHYDAIWKQSSAKATLSSMLGSVEFDASGRLIVRTTSSVSSLFMSKFTEGMPLVTKMSGIDKLIELGRIHEIIPFDKERESFAVDVFNQFLDSLGSTSVAPKAGPSTFPREEIQTIDRPALRTIYQPITPGPSSAFPSITNLMSVRTTPGSDPVISFKTREGDLISRVKDSQRAPIPLSQRSKPLPPPPNRPASSAPVYQTPVAKPSSSASSVDPRARFASPSPSPVIQSTPLTSPAPRLVKITTFDPNGGLQVNPSVVKSVQSRSFSPMGSTSIAGTSRA